MSHPRTTSGASHLRNNGVPPTHPTEWRRWRRFLDRRIVHALLTLGVYLLIAGAPALAQNRPPVADAGPDQSIWTNESTILLGSATDPDNNLIIGWLWTIESQPVGSVPYLSSPDWETTSFLGNVAGDYVISLIASDGLVWSAPDFVTIHVTDLLPPVAIATADVTSGPAPLSVQFDASQSYDPQGGSLFIDWDFGDYSTGSNEVSPVHTYQTPGGYTAILTVIDQLSQAAIDTILITITDPPTPSFKIDSPVFNAGGHPDDGIILTSSGYRMTLDALGDAAGAVALGSASWRMEAGLTPGYRPPGEVMNLRFDDATTLRWDAEPTAGLYNLYDGDTCLPPALTQTMTTITADPGPGGCFIIQVTAENTLGEEGTRGYKSDHSERLNPTPCP